MTDNPSRLMKANATRNDHGGLTCDRGRLPMRYSVLASTFFVLSACLFVPTILVEAQTTTPPAPPVGAQRGEGAPDPGRGARGGMALSSDTPLAETENLDAYPAAPEGFNIARASIA